VDRALLGTIEYVRPFERRTWLLLDGNDDLLNRLSGLIRVQAPILILVQRLDAHDRGLLNVLLQLPSFFRLS